LRRAARSASSCSCAAASAGSFDRQRRGVRAAQHHRRAHRLHQVELALGALQAPQELRLGHAFEIAKRLVEVDRQAEVGGDAAQLGGRALEVDEVGLEQLDAVEPGGRDGFELLAKGAAERDRGDGAMHGVDFRNPGPAPQSIRATAERLSNAFVH
jgi:hypothetical protein